VSKQTHEDLLGLEAAPHWKDEALHFVPYSIEHVCTFARWLRKYLDNIQPECIGRLCADL
jgi:hypothetical protein